MGNSEVGHLNLGAGSVVMQDLTRIDDAIADGSFFENPALKAACEAARSGPRGRLHLMGLVSDGGVHSGWEHIEACIELAAQEGVPDLVVHAFTDGRDTPPTGGAGYVRGARALAAPRRAASGRSAAATTPWTATVAGIGPSSPTTRSCTPRAATPPAPLEAVERSYAAGRDRRVRAPDRDRRLRRRSPTATSVIHFNFRPDRARQLVRALAEPGFDEFAARHGPRDQAHHADRVPRGLDLPGGVPAEGAGRDAGRDDRRSGGGRQLHVAETEKYAHVTYFFNGGREAEWEGEERRLVPSPRDVATYDHSRR